MIAFARRQPSAILLAGQLAAVLIYPFLDDENAVGRALFSVMGIVFLGLVLFAVRSSPALTWIGVVLAVPATAVITDAEGSYVLRVENGVIERRPVEAGLLWQDWREIAAGLEAGDQVVARAGAFFSDGDLIRVVEGEAPEVVQ